MNVENIIAINGVAYEFDSGETILQVARKNKIAIPTLCHLSRATPTGACRICVVEVKGARSLMTSCTTPAVPNMEVQTDCKKVILARKMLIKLLLSSGDHTCLICPSNGACDLQNLAFQYQVKSNFPDTYKRHDLEDANPYIVRDFSKCVLCGKCVQACNDIQVNNAINFGYRGESTKIIAGKDKALKDSDCVFCGECVQACPTGALVEKSDRFVARTWETEKTRTTCPHCSVGCQINLHVKKKQIVKVSGVEETAPNYGSLCVKGRYGFEFIGSKNRLTKPLIKKNNTFEEASWDEALALIAKKLSETIDKYGGDKIGLLASEQITNEDNYVAQKFARAVLKSNNIDYFSQLDHSAVTSGLMSTFGSAVMMNHISDFEKADVVLVVGANMTDTHPIISTYIKRAVKHKATKLIVVDSREVDLTNHAEVWLQPKLGSAVAWINGLCHVIIRENLYDKNYVSHRTENFDLFSQAIKKYTPEYVEEITRVSVKDIEKTARLYSSAKTAIIAFGDEFFQHKAEIDAVKCLANLGMLCGHFETEGGGMTPLRLQNNMQAVCEMGGLPNFYSGYQNITTLAVKDEMEKGWGIKELSSKPDLKETDMALEMLLGNLKAMIILGGIPVRSDSNRPYPEASFQKLDFLVVQDIFITETAKQADVILPTTCFAEKNGSFTNIERKVQYVRKAVEAPDDCRDDWAIISEISSRMGFEMSYRNSSNIMDEIARLTPSYAGINHQRIQTDEACWLCQPGEHLGTPLLHKGKFVFTPIEDYYSK